MSVIIRLQNLPWSANALDIRQFFNGLSIPEGGVHIVGGELGDAFIAFSTDEDARQAFNNNGGKLKEVQVKLMLSSRTEMQKVIEAARTPLAAFMQAAPVPPPLPPILPASIPSLQSEINNKKDDLSKDKDKRERRRSRTRSRDRKERSRDRDRRDRRNRRDRSRSRSRDRRDRRRRDRSHSRERRSKDRDRRSKDRKNADDKLVSSSNSSLNSNAQKDHNKMGVWEDPLRNDPVAVSRQSPAIQQAQAILQSFIPKNFDEARRNLNALPVAATLLANRNILTNTNEGFMNNRGRENWNNGPVRGGDTRTNFVMPFNRNLGSGRNDDGKFNNNLSGGNNMMNQGFGDNKRMGFNRGPRLDNRQNRFDNDRPAILDRLGPMPGNLDRSNNEQMKNCCIRLQPYYGGYGEVRRFFQGIFIHNTGIKFINDDMGKRTGIVYIRFATADGKEEALDRNGGQLKSNNVLIEHIDDDVFDKTVDRYHPEQNTDSPERTFNKSNRNSPIVRKPLTQFSCLAVELLPLFTKEQDMLKIFSDFSLQSILLVNKQRNITAYIKFTQADDAKQAQIEKSKQVFDGKLLHIRPCSDEEFAIINHDEEPAQNNETTIEIEDEDDKTFGASDCVCLSGLPVKTTDRDVSDFFSDVAVVPNKIHLINSNLGFTGVAYCEFSTVEDAEIALDKNGLPLGSGTVTVQSVTRPEMESKIEIPNINNAPMNRPLNLMRPVFHPRNFGAPRGGFLPRAMGLMGHRPLLRRFPPPPPSADHNDMSVPGHTVRMENVPYKAVLGEILEFFEGFDIPADNVLRRYNENGTPSGEAKVIFKSSEEAFQACQERNLGKIRERTIFLHQC